MITHNLNPSAKLFDLDSGDKTKLFFDLIEKYCDVTGIEVEISKIDRIVKNLNYWIEGKLSRMSVCHVVKAFEMAIEGEYHTGRTLEAKNIIEWLNKLFASYRSGLNMEIITSKEAEIKRAETSRYPSNNIFDSSYGTAVLLRCMYFTGKDRPDRPTLDEVADAVKGGVDIYSGKPIKEVLSSKKFEFKRL